MSRKFIIIIAILFTVHHSLFTSKAYAVHEVEKEVPEAVSVIKVIPGAKSPIPS